MPRVGSNFVNWGDYLESNAGDVQKMGAPISAYADYLNSVGEDAAARPDYLRKKLENERAWVEVQNPADETGRRRWEIDRFLDDPNFQSEAADTKRAEDYAALLGNDFSLQQELRRAGRYGFDPAQYRAERNKLSFGGEAPLDTRRVPPEREPSVMDAAMVGSTMGDKLRNLSERLGLSREAYDKWLAANRPVWGSKWQAPAPPAKPTPVVTAPKPTPRLDDPYQPSQPLPGTVGGIAPGMGEALQPEMSDIDEKGRVVRVGKIPKVSPEAVLRKERKGAGEDYWSRNRSSAF